MKGLSMCFLYSNLIKEEILASALTFWLAFLHSSSTCSLKVTLLSIFIPKSFFTARTWKLLIRNIHLMNFLIAEKTLKSIWILFHTIILKPQSKPFRRTLNFINYFQFWTTRCKWCVIICINYKVDVLYKQKKITKKDIKRKWA